MQYRSVNEIAKKWNVSERSVRNYCAHGRVDGAFLTGKTWNIPENAEKPERSNKKKEQPITLLDILKEQKVSKYSGGIYHKTQIDLTYNSNHIEGSRLLKKERPKEVNIQRLFTHLYDPEKPISPGVTLAFVAVALATG